jgi:hypothetical protein
VPPTRALLLAALAPARQAQDAGGGGLVQRGSMHGLAVAAAVQRGAAHVAVQGEAVLVGGAVQRHVRHSAGLWRYRPHSARVAHRVAHRIPPAHQQQLWESGGGGGAGGAAAQADGLGHGRG